MKRAIFSLGSNISIYPKYSWLNQNQRHAGQKRPAWRRWSKNTWQTNYRMANIVPTGRARNTKKVDRGRHFVATGEPGLARLDGPTRGAAGVAPDDCPRP
jgi:hypothetical protein